MKPGKLAAFLMQQKKTGIFIFNTTVLVIASFVAGYNLRLNETNPSATLVVRLTSDYITGAMKRFTSPPGSLHTTSLHTPPVIAVPPAPPLDKEPPRQSVKKETPVVKPPAEPITQPPPRAALTPEKAPVKKKKIKKREVPSKASTEKKKSWSGYTDVIRTIEKGETVSHFVRRSHIRDFVAYNKNLTDPDRIYAGQSLIVKLPTAFVTSALSTGKTYRNNYLITTAADSLGRKVFRLVKKTAPAEPETLLSHLIKKERRTITKSTIPYLNLSGYTDTLTQQKKSPAAVSGDLSLTKTASPLDFRIDFSNKAFENTRFHGFKSLEYLQFSHNTNAIKEFIRHLTRNHAGAGTDADYHFLVFGETLVQIRYLEEDIFRPENREPVVHIGVVHKTTDTPDTLRTLQQELSQSRVTGGRLEIITAQNISLFFN